ENCSESPVHVDVRGAVHRVEQERVARAAGAFAIDVGLLHLFGCDETHQAAVVEGLDEDVVRPDVQLLLLFALDVFGAGRTAGVADVGNRELSRDAFSRDPEPQEELGQLAGGGGSVRLAFQEEAVQRRSRPRHGRRFYGMGDVAFVHSRHAGFGFPSAWTRPRCAKNAARRTASAPILRPSGRGGNPAGSGESRGSGSRQATYRANISRDRSVVAASRRIRRTNSACFSGVEPFSGAEE